MIRILSLAVLLWVPRTVAAQRLADLAPAAAVPSGAPQAPAPRDSASSAPAVRTDTGPTLADTVSGQPPRSRRGRHARRGAVIGAALGVGVALFVSHGLQEPASDGFLDQRQTWEAAGVLGAAGALVGAVLGALVP